MTRLTTHRIPAESPQRRRTGDPIVNHVQICDLVDGARQPDRWCLLSTDDHTGGPTGRRFLDLSTAHLPEQLGSYGLSGQDGVVAYHLPHG